MTYVIRTTNGPYIAKLGHSSTYTPDLLHARTWSVKTETRKYRSSDELVLSIDQILAEAESRMSQPKVARCDMEPTCTGEIQYVDPSGFVYCEHHGKQRQQGRKCRRLRPYELRRIAQGKQITRY